MAPCGAHTPFGQQTPFPGQQRPSPQLVEPNEHGFVPEEQVAAPPPQPPPAQQIGLLVLLVGLQKWSPQQVPPVGLQAPLQQASLSAVQATPAQQVPSLSRQTPLQQISSEPTQHLKGPPHGRSVPAAHTSDGGGSQSACVAPHLPSLQQIGRVGSQQFSAQRVPPPGHVSHCGLLSGQHFVPLRIGVAAGQHWLLATQTSPAPQVPPVGQQVAPEAKHRLLQHCCPLWHAPAPQQTVPAGWQEPLQQTSLLPQQPPPQGLLHVVLPPPPPPVPLATPLAHQSAAICAAALQLQSAAQTTFEAPPRAYQQVQAPPPVGQLVHAAIEPPFGQLVAVEQVAAASAGPGAATTAISQSNRRLRATAAPFDA